MNNTFPIIEFDPSPRAILEPGEIVVPCNAPERCVICFFQEVLRGLVDSGQARIITESHSEIGTHPLYEIICQGQRVAVFHPGIGAPLAVGLLEEMIPRGCRKFVACGGCGVLDRDIAVGHLIVPVSAVRDEGTSYHYLPPAREVSASPDALHAIECVLQRHQVKYLLSKTWTTDAIYRETPAKAERMKAEGCLTVEMEAAAFFAAAQFRGVTLGEILYGGDAVIPGAWDDREWVSRESIREKLFWLAVESVLEIEPG